jgi:two-component system LytT family response regulator
MYVLIIDDEPRSAMLLQSMLLKLLSGNATIAIVKNFKEALDYFPTHTVDVLFIDTEINGKSAFDLLDKIQRSTLKIIVTSVSKENAFKAFEYGAIDYLLKPISLHDLKSSINRIY